MNLHFGDYFFIHYTLFNFIFPCRLDLVPNLENKYSKEKFQEKSNIY